MSNYNEHDARELDLYAERLHGQFKSIIANLQRKIKSGKYDAARADWYEAAAKRYAKEFADASDWSRMFPRPLRMHLAKERAAQEYQNILRGEYGAV